MGRDRKRKSLLAMNEDEKKDESDSTVEPPSSNESNEKPNPAVTLDTPAKDAKSSSKRKRRLPAMVLGSLLHFLLLDCPVLLTFTGYYATILMERFYNEYIAPQMDLQYMSEERKSRELTYYHRTCSANDMTATDIPKLVIDYDTMTTDDAMHHMLRHGVSVYPNLLSESTAEQVRNFILRQNEKNEDMISVIENENRWSFGVRVDQDPSIPKALTEILSNEYLVESMEKIMGPNPAIIEFTGITSAYGAKMQRYHADVVPEGSAAKWARTFIPSYSLFIPLQNITSAMGATEVCPGSHMCADGVFDYCPEHGFQVSGSNNNWPLGAGALVNQQLMHRGQAHSDPHGPHRVLFIVTFAPRPRFREHELETRSLAQGGSYSLHWMQWGYTLRDLIHAPKYMTMPWRFLRSMGMYKPRGRQWGWDYITTASARIANSETGFFYHELLDMLKSNQFNWIPKHLHGDIPEESDDSRDIWVPFYLSTLHKCQKAIESIHRSAVVSYLVLMLVLVAASSQRRASDLVRNLGRLVFIHLAIYLMGELLFRRISQSSYARNQRAHRSFQWPALAPVDAPDLPGTLPRVHDVLVAEDMQSEYMASYTEILDVVHPGNSAWVGALRHYSAGYDKLTPQSQLKQCSILIDWSRLQGRRVLFKNKQNQWAEATKEMALRFCHKEMLKQTNPYLRQAIRQVDFLRMEVKFGYWRDSLMHRRFISTFLNDLQSRILRVPSMQRPGNSKRQVYRPSQRRKVLTSLNQRNNLPSASSGSQWSGFQVNDKVEAAYASLQTEWYLATITGVDAHSMTWDVAYQDGEKESGLCLACVRSFVPYGVGDDNVECRLQGEVIFKRCSVLAANSDGTYMVQLSNGHIRESFEPKGMRRVSYISDGKFKVGDAVMAPYNGSGLYPATVGKVNRDGTYAVRFDEGGEFVSSIFGRIMVLQSEYDFDYFGDDDDEDDDFDDEEYDD